MLLFRTVTVAAVLCIGVNGADHPMKELRNSGGVYPSSAPIVMGEGGDIPDWSFEHEPPNKTLNPETDNGGYRYWSIFKQDLNTWPFTDVGYCFNAAGGVQYIMATIMKVPEGKVPISRWNCSILVQTQDHFFGQVDQFKICDPGNCCEGWIGKHRLRDDAEKVHLDLETQVKAGLCSDLPMQIYCMVAGGNYQTSCAQTYTSPTHRPFPMIGCMDFYFNYWSGCPVYKTSGVYPTAAVEPPGYRSQWTPSDGTLFMALYQTPDRICLPVSYYSGESDDVADDESSGTLYIGSFLVLLKAL